MKRPARQYGLSAVGSRLSARSKRRDSVCFERTSLPLTSHGAHTPLDVQNRWLTADSRSPIDVFNVGEAEADVEAMPDARLEALLPADLIHDDEIIILLLRPSVFYIILASLGGLLVITVITLLMALLAAKVPWIFWTEYQAYGLGGLLLALRLGWQALDWFNRVFVLTDRRVLTRAGVLRVTVFETRLHQIQHAMVFRRIRERVFGLGSIAMATSGSDTFDTFWLMLRQPFSVHRTIVEAIQRYGRGGNLR